MSWTYRDTIPGISAGGPNPTDTFSLRLVLPDANSAPGDATSFAFSFPDTLASASDIAALALMFSDSNAALADSLIRLAIAMDDSNSSPTDSVSSLSIGYSDSNSLPTDATAIALTVLDSNLVGTDSLTRLAIGIAESLSTQSDNVSFENNILLTDTISSATDALLGLRVSGMNDSNANPTDGESGTGYFWLSGTTGTSGNTTTPTNANGANDTANATAKTVTLGATSAILTSNCGSGIPNGTPFTSAIYRGWFNCSGGGAASTQSVVCQSATGLFADITMLSVQTGTNHSGGTFTFDLLAAGVNTLAKLQSVKILHRSVDIVAGVGGQIAVDAGRIELVGIL